MVVETNVLRAGVTSIYASCIPITDSSPGIRSVLYNPVLTFKIIGLKDNDMIAKSNEQC